MIYLSGRITGLDREDYLEIFEYYENKLKGKGDVINPAKVLDKLPVLCYHEYMQIALKLLSFCDTIYLLPTWAESKGAREEVQYALDHDYKIISTTDIF